LKLHSLVRRRPSPAMAISLVALFMSLGGVGYAATQLPDNSVGTAQLKNNAVTYQKIEPNSVGKVRLADGGVINSKLSNGSVSYKKIQPAAVGRVRANLNQLQARVNGTCSTGSAIGAVDSKGATTCNSTRPAEFGTTAANVTVAATATPVNSLNLPAGSTYLALANPEASVTVTGPSERVLVTCTLSVGTSSVTRSVTVDSGATGTTTNMSIPLQLATPAGAASVACSGTTTGAVNPAVKVDSAINAIQTASNS
jgi:hypothetical protein